MRGALIGIGLALVVLSIAAPRPASAAECAPGDQTCQALQDARRSQADAARRLDDIRRSIVDAQQKAIRTLAYVNELDGQIERQRGAIADTRTRIDQIDRQIRFTEADILRQTAHLEVRQQLLAGRVRAMDERGSLDYLELVVTSQSFSQLVDRIMIMQDIVRSENELVDTLRREREQIRVLRQREEAERIQQANLLKEQQEQEAALEATIANQRSALDYYRQLEAQFEARRRELEAEKARIDDLVRVLQARYDSEAGSLGGGSGRFSWPLRGPITQGFGCTDLIGEPYDPSCPSRHFHTGIDIGAPFGTPVGAADAGVVSFVNWGWGGGYGNYVIVTHGSGYATLYAHLSAISAAAGQPVRRGQTIGLEGSTGYSTGPHLHFEIRLNGAYQNPLSYLG